MTSVLPTGYLRSGRTRARLARLNTGAILKRFFFCEEALIRGQAGWIAAIGRYETKMLVARLVWEDALVAGELRQRVFELRYPSRLMEVGEDLPLVSIYEDARHAPHAAAYLHALAHLLIPALGQAYRAYLEVADDLGDAPTRRFLGLAAGEKERQAAELLPLVEALLAADPALRDTAGRWTAALRERLDAAGGLSLDSPHATVHAGAGPLPGSVPFALAEVAAHDIRFHLGRFYWPDNVDPAYPYGEGIALQLRSAVSHLNEVWAVDTAGAILEAFAEPLGWEFVSDAARWLYDESRHAMMGLTRLRDWGFSPRELPLGSYIYDSARGEDPIYRLGMLHFFETKNIGKKTKRAEAFGSYGDTESQHDMEFDWADEGMHAGYGKRWLVELVRARGLPPQALDAIHDRCGELVAATVAGATGTEIADIRAVTARLLDHARDLADGHRSHAEQQEDRR